MNSGWFEITKTEFLRLKDQVALHGRTSFEDECSLWITIFSSYGGYPIARVFRREITERPFKYEANGKYVQFQDVENG